MATTYGRTKSEGALVSGGGLNSGNATLSFMSRWMKPSPAASAAASAAAAAAAASKSTSSSAMVGTSVPLDAQQRPPPPPPLQVQVPGLSAAQPTVTRSTPNSPMGSVRKTPKADMLRKQQFKLVAAHSFLSNISLGTSTPSDSIGASPALLGEDSSEPPTADEPIRPRLSSNATRLDKRARGKLQDVDQGQYNPSEPASAVDTIGGPVTKSSSKQESLGLPLTAVVPTDSSNNKIRSRANTWESNDDRRRTLNDASADDGPASSAVGSVDVGETELPESSTMDISALRNGGASSRRGSFADNVRPPYIYKLQQVKRLDREHLRHVSYDHLPPRLFFSTVRETTSSFPFGVSSVIRYDEERLRKKKKAAPSDVDVLGIPKNKTMSFEPLFIDDSPDVEQAHLSQTQYDPNDLDDPELSTGKHRFVSTLPSVRLSIIPFVRPIDLRRELNEQFRQKHPHLDPQMSLSKIRKLKQLLLEVALSPDIDLEVGTVAMSFVYIERLILKNVLRKANRKVLAGACLILAAKANDPKFVIMGERTSIQSLVVALEDTLKVTAATLYDAEFSVFAALDFHVHVSPEQVIPHFERIIASQQFSNVQEYLGPEMYRQFYTTKDVAV